MKIEGLSLGDQLRMIRGVEGITPKKTEATTEKPAGAKSFGEYLAQSFEQTNQLGLEAERAIERSVAGEEVNPHATMIAIQKADISLSLLMSVKERIERAYQEIIRMPV